MANRLKMALIDAILSLKARGWSNRRIATELGVDRDTVARQLRRAEQANAATAPIGSATIRAESNAATAPIGSPTIRAESNAATAPIGADAAAVPVPAGSRQPTQSACEPWRDVILAKLDLGLTAQRIHQDLVAEHGFTAAYHSVRRFVRHLGKTRPLPFRRMECAAGEEAQVDFGTGAPIQTAEGKRRTTHVFRIVLSHSRKAYSEAVYRQTTEEFIRCLENAFWYWGGVPKALVLDNLKAGVEQADWYDPELNPKLRAFADHYGLAVLPTRPRMPRHKGKTESGIGYVKKNALKGHVFASLEAENQHLLHWETTVADVRVHGTIRQQVGKLFAEIERPALQPLPTTRFAFFHEGRRTVHRDGHVEVARAYYSVPPEYLARRVWVRWDGHLVRIFNERMEPIATHVQREAGRFSTQQAHIAAEKISNVERGAAWLLGQTRRIGPHAARWSEAVVQVRGIEGVRVLQGLLHLASRHPCDQLEKACDIALSYGCYRLRTIRTLLKRAAPRQESFAFVDEHPIIRSLSEYAQLVHNAVQKEAGR
jgi:transposase